MGPHHKVLPISCTGLIKLCCGNLMFSSYWSVSYSLLSKVTNASLLPPSPSLGATTAAVRIGTTADNLCDEDGSVWLERPVGPTKPTAAAGPWAPHALHTYT